MKINNIYKLTICIVGSELAGIIGAIFSRESIPTWYLTIAKPSFNPPNWIFGPVWITLYILMGISAYLVWTSVSEKKDAAKKINALEIYGLQLALNMLWSIVFFGMRSPGLAFIEIVFLWLSIIATIVTFYRISKTAALLLVPYILWVSFAGYLNYSIWLLNR